MKQFYVSELFSAGKRLCKGVTLLMAFVLNSQVSDAQQPSAARELSSSAQPSAAKPEEEEHLTFLPGTLVGWSVEVKDGNASISWTTTVEKNSKRFVILKSFNGKQFFEVLSKEAKGNSDKQNKYTCSDKVRATTGKVYYKLRMEDNDHMSYHTDVVVVNADNGSQLLLYPNPTVDEIKVTVSRTWQGKELVFDIYNNYGQLVRQKKQVTASQTENMNVADLPAGMYIVKVSNGGEKLTRQFIKSKS